MAKAKTKKTEEVKEATVVRPEDLAKELGVSGKQVRAFLRKEFGEGHEKRTSWLLNAKQAEAVRTRFTADDTDEE